MSLSARERIADMWTIARGRRPRYAEAEPDDEAAPDLEGGTDALAVACAVVASVALGGTAGRLIPEPYFHALVDWLLYAVVGGAAALALGSVADEEATPMARALAAGAVVASVLGAAGLLLGWTAYETVFAAWIGLLGGMALTIAPALAAVCLGIGAAVGLLGLAIELATGDVESLGEGFGLVLRATGVFGLALLLALALFEKLYGEKPPWRA